MMSTFLSSSFHSKKLRALSNTGKTIAKVSQEKFTLVNLLKVGERKLNFSQKILRTSLTTWHIMSYSNNENAPPFWNHCIKLLGL